MSITRAKSSTSPSSIWNVFGAAGRATSMNPIMFVQQDMDREMWFDAINEIWYEVNEDWN
jgi:hypothetical protein